MGSSQSCSPPFADDAPRMILGCFWLEHVMSFHIKFVNVCSLHLLLLRRFMRRDPCQTFGAWALASPARLLLPTMRLAWRWAVFGWSMSCLYVMRTGVHFICFSCAGSCAETHAEGSVHGLWPLLVASFCRRWSVDAGH